MTERNDDSPAAQDANAGRDDADHVQKVARRISDSARNPERLEFVVYGTPAPQGSKRHVGRGIMIESSKKLRPWRDAVRYEAVNARNGAPPIDAAVMVGMVFTFPRPKSHYRTGKNAHLLRDDAPDSPVGKPDLSKLARSTEDALVDAGVLRDDSRIVEYVRLAKFYVGADRDALDAPGVRIEIRSP